MEVVLSECDLENSLKYRKRPIDPAKWKANERKRLRNSGQQYTSKRGRLVPALTPPTGARKCPNNCRFRTCGQLTVGEKQDFFHSYYAMGKSDTQRTYLLSLMEKARVGPVRTSYRYFLILNGQRKEVCKLTFMDVFKIKSKKVRNIQKNLNANRMAVIEGRGKHLRPQAQKLQVKQQIRGHILQQEIQPVHYTTRRQGTFYLPPNLSVKRMFEDFQTLNPTVNCKSWLYQETFREMGIALSKPRSDTCRVCDLLHLERMLASPNQVMDVEQRMHAHHFHADEGYRAMSKDIEESRRDPNLVVKIVDMQQVLFSPTLRHQDVFYLRQYTSYNHCIYDAGSDTGNMFFWTESEGKRGVNELGSCLLLHIKQVYQPLGANQERELILWSDRCVGQNNNYIMVALFHYLIAEQYFTRIEQKFLISGHTYMVCDRFFGLIEKRKRSSSAMVPDDWVTVIQEAQPSRPFPVNRLRQQDILDLKQLVVSTPKPGSLKVTTCAVIQLSSGNPDSILTRSDHSPGVWSQHLIQSLNPGLRRSRRRTTALRRCYTGLLPLPQPKKDNITSMLPFLLPAQRAFYENMMQA